MKEPLRIASMRLAAMNPDVKDLWDPDEPSKGGGKSEVSASARKELGEEYKTLEGQLRALQDEMEKIGGSISAVVEKIEASVASLHKSGFTAAESWLDTLPLNEMQREIKAGPRDHSEENKTGLHAACDDVLDEIGTSVARIRTETIHLEIGYARSVAMLGTVEAVRYDPRSSMTKDSGSSTIL